jgi:hypothetical protein
LDDPQVGGLGTLENPSSVNADLATDSHEARPVADLAAGRGEFMELIDRWNGKV